MKAKNASRGNFAAASARSDLTLSGSFSAISPIWMRRASAVSGWSRAHSASTFSAAAPSPSRLKTSASASVSSKSPGRRAMALSRYSLPFA